MTAAIAVCWDAKVLLSFNDVIAHGGLGLEGVRLLRHVREGLVRWRRGPEHFDDYTSYQNTGNGGPLNNTSVAFGFVPGPKLEDGDDTALFVRAHRVMDRWRSTRVRGPGRCGRASTSQAVNHSVAETERDQRDQGPS